MKKEVFLAIFFGLGIGSIIGFGIYNANKTLKNQPQNNLSPSPTLTTDTNLTPLPDQTEHYLVINSPLNTQVLNEKTITVTGTTTPGSTIIITTEDNEHLLIPDKSGDFAQEIKLIAGVNFLNFTSISPQDEHLDQPLSLIYTTYEI
jgi:hypothetical protein